MKDKRETLLERGMLIMRNMTTEGIVYLRKALCEIKSTNEVGRRIGLELSDEKEMENALCSPNNTCSLKINMCYVMRPVERLLHLLSDSFTEIEEEFLVSNILLALAHMNDLLDKFDSVGISIDCDTFDGHFYGVISALSKALDYFTDIDSNDDETHATIDTVSLDNYIDVAKEVAKQHSLAIREKISYIKQEMRN